MRVLPVQATQILQRPYLILTVYSEVKVHTKFFDRLNFCGFRFRMQNVHMKYAKAPCKNSLQYGGYQHVFINNSEQREAIIGYYRNFRECGGGRR